MLMEFCGVQVAVQVASNKKEAFNIEELSDVIDIFFFQNFVYGNPKGGTCPGEFNGKLCKKRARIPSEQCKFGSNREDNNTHIKAL